MLSLDRLKHNERYNNLLYYETHIVKYKSLSDHVRNMSYTKQIEFIGIDNTQVIQSIVTQCNLWHKTYLDILDYITQKLYNDTLTDITNYNTQYNQCNDNIDQLYTLYTTLQRYNIDMDIVCIDLDERYRALKMYNTFDTNNTKHNPDSKAQNVIQIQQQWNELLTNVKNKIHELQVNDNEQESASVENSQDDIDNQVSNNMNGLKISVEQPTVTVQ